MYYNRQIMNPESIYHLLEVGTRGKQDDFIWPVAGEATVNDKVFIVCAGTGSFYNDETASKLVCQFMAAKVSKFGEREMSGELIDKLLLEARDRLITFARVHRLDTDLATTFSMLILYDQRAFLSWYGDSRIYLIRGEEILFSTEDNPAVSESLKNSTIARGIKADSSAIHARTKWIGDVRDGDYFFLCSKSATGNETPDDIKLLVSQNEKANIDPAGSFRQLVVEKTTENSSMYLVRVHMDTQKMGISSGIIAIRKRTGGVVSPFFILAMTIIAVLMMFFYFRKAPTSESEPKLSKETTHPVYVVRDDSVSNALFIQPPRKPSVVVIDTSKKNKIENLPPEPPASPTPQAPPTPQDPPTPQKDNSPVIQPEEMPEPAKQAPVSQKKGEAQLLLKFSTDESCNLKITNIDLDEVINWDLSQNDNGNIYLKPGKYLIVATSVINSSKTKIYHFDVKPGNGRTTQNLHIQF
jgi:PPM family protein phosphatase